MSTKFRQSFILLCDEWCRPTKNQHANAARPCKEYSGRQAMRENELACSSIALVTRKISHQQPEAIQLQDRESFLPQSFSMPIPKAPIDITKSNRSEFCV